MTEEEGKAMLMKERERFIQMMDVNTLPEYAHKICNEISTQIELIRFAMSIAAVTSSMCSKLKEGPMKQDASDLRERTVKTVLEFCDCVITFRANKEAINRYVVPLIKEIKKEKKK